MALFLSECNRCGCTFTYPERVGQVPPEECNICVKLGDRSLVSYMRRMQLAKSPEERAAIRALFDAAKGRSNMELPRGVR